jgi:hypothetical protein
MTSEEPEGPGFVRRISGNLQRQSSNSLVRTTTQVLSGGVTFSEPIEGANRAAGETDPERQPLLRRSTTRQSRQQRIAEEMQNFINLYGKCICLFIFVFFVLAFVSMGVMIWAVRAAVVYHDRPCDQPLLKFYIFVALAWAATGPVIHRYVLLPIVFRLFTSSPVALALISLWTSIPTFSILAWGIHMILKSKTCHETNPGLFYPTRNYMIVQCVMSVFGIVFALGSIIFTRYALLVLSRLIEGPGCKEAVAKLPKVPKDSKDLVDPEDGTIMNCLICWDALDVGEAAVRCPCDHMFHVDCLTTWAQSHATCPTCRAEIGPPDEENG